MPMPRWPPAREPRPPLSQLARPRSPRGGGVLFPGGRPLLDAWSRRDAWGGQGGPWRRPWRPGAEAPRGLYGVRPAPRVARAPTPHRAWSRGPPQGGSRAEERGAPSGAHGGLSGRRRGRGDGAAGHAARGGLVLGVPHGHEHDGDVGRPDVSPRDRGGVSQARQAERVQGSPWPTRGVGSPQVAGWGGQGVSRAARGGQHEGHSGGGRSLVSQAMPPRDLFLSPATSRLP